MRFPIPWVRATTFGFVGFLLALAFAVLMLGPKSVQWVLLPSVLAAAAAVYAISTWLGMLAARTPRGLLLSVLIGVGVALATLIAGVAAFGFGNILLGWLGEITSAYSDDRQIYISISGDIYAYVFKPIGAVLLFGGGLMAPILGAVYGLQLHATSRTKSERKW